MVFIYEADDDDTQTKKKYNKKYNNTKKQKGKRKLRVDCGFFSPHNFFFIK